MLIRLTALFALVASGCGFQSAVSPDEPAVSEPELSEVAQPVTNTCDPVNYPCDPFDPVANGVCQLICGGDGYCLEYSAVEYVWCGAHPDKFMTPTKYCGPNGDPMWHTHCLPGFLP
jgi:hypothetical protein